MKKFFRSLCGALFPAFALAMAWPALAGNAIDRVELSQLPDRVLVKISLREPLGSNPSSFSVAAPPRVAFDFADTENASGSGVVGSGVGVVKGINIVQAGPRTRVVLNLSTPVQYESKVEDKYFFISLLNSASAQSTAVEAKSLARPAAAMSAGQPRESYQPTISNIDFQATSVDLATVKIDLSDPNVALDVQKQGSSGLALVFPGAGIPQSLEKKLDVRDFGSPVGMVSAMRLGKGAQILLSNRGEWDYSVRQIDASVVLEVRRVKADSNIVNSKELQGKIISFNFTQPIPVGQMIGIFQDITGLNFMVMPGVAGEIQSLKMENTPVNVAIDVISRMYGLGFRRYGDIVVVGKSDDLAKYDRDERERAAALEKLEPIEQDSFKVRYRSAAEIVQALTGGSSGTAGASGSGNSAGGLTPPPNPSSPGSPTSPSAGTQQGLTGGASKSMITDRGTISFDSVTNTIFVEETRSQLEKIRQRVQVLDRPVKQVMIEARIVIVQDNFSKSLGAKIGFLGVNRASSITGTLSSISPNVPSGAGTTFNSPGAGRATQFSGGYSSSKGTDLNLLLFNSDQTRLVNLQLTADESDGKSKSVATPKVITQDGRQATITAGQ
ncbi:MAG TPA: secretin N-terminal domain-containing protein, partial [Accumulibacter sp.]|nr:secretin N-terminal domain-containing protein [Accumulibacter sp.]